MGDERRAGAGVLESGEVQRALFRGHEFSLRGEWVWSRVRECSGIDKHTIAGRYTTVPPARCRGNYTASASALKQQGDTHTHTINRTQKLTHTDRLRQTHAERLCIQFLQRLTHIYRRNQETHTHTRKHTYIHLQTSSTPLSPSLPSHGTIIAGQMRKLFTDISQGVICLSSLCM